MILVDFIAKYLISIVLLVITYFYLAETKSINKLSLDSCVKSNQNYLFYTTGSCYLKYIKLDNNLQIKRDTLNKINLTDCELNDNQLFKKFDYYFDDLNKLQLVTFNNKDFKLSIGELNLNETLFKISNVYQLNNSNINFVIDKQNKFIYLSNQDLNQIERINLKNGLKNKLELNCKSPNYLQIDDNKLIWIEIDQTLNNQKITCFKEWSFENGEQLNLGCVEQKVQSFQILSNDQLKSKDIYFVKNGGSLFKLDKMNYDVNIDNLKIINSIDQSKQDSINRLANSKLNQIIKPKLIYNAISIKRKFQIQIFNFKLIKSKTSIDLYLSDLRHQALLLANLSKTSTDEYGNNKPEIVLSDQPSLFDFKFLNLIDYSNECKKEIKSNNEDLLIDMNIKYRIIDKENKINQNNLANKLSDNKDQTLIIQKDEQIRLNLNDTKLNLVNYTDETIPLANQFCTIVSCNPIINLIVFIISILIFILSALIIVLSSKKRYNTLIQNDPDLDKSNCCFFKNRLNNIQFNIKKTIQTI